LALFFCAYYVENILFLRYCSTPFPVSLKEWFAYVSRGKVRANILYGWVRHKEYVYPLSHTGTEQQNFFKKKAAFWDVVPCSLIEVDQRFKGSYCLWNVGLLQDYKMLYRRKCHLHTHCCENLKSHRISIICNFCVLF
jgi:hypothetical protein